MEKVKNVVIGVLIVGIICALGYLLCIGIAYYSYKDAILKMYNRDNYNELLVYETEIINLRGEKMQVPVINLAFDKVEELNKEIKKIYEKIDVSLTTDKSYIYTVENDVLYLAICIDYKEERNFILYRVDVRNGKSIVDNKMLIEQYEQYYGLKIDEEKYNRILKEKSYTMWQEKNKDEDLLQFEQYNNLNNPIIISAGRLFVFTKYMVNSEYYQGMIEINLSDIIYEGE